VFAEAGAGRRHSDDAAGNAGCRTCRWPGRSRSSAWRSSGSSGGSTLVMILPTDLFPRRCGVGTVGGARGAGRGTRRRGPRADSRGTSWTTGLAMLRCWRSRGRCMLAAFCRDSGDGEGHPSADWRENMKITEVRTRAIEWRGGMTVPLPPHFCTNPMDSLGARRRRRWGVVHVSRLGAGVETSSPTTGSWASGNRPRWPPR